MPCGGQGCRERSTQVPGREWAETLWGLWSHRTPSELGNPGKFPSFLTTLAKSGRVEKCWIESGDGDSKLGVTFAHCDYGQVPSTPRASVSPSVKRGLDSVLPQIAVIVNCFRSQQSFLSGESRGPLLPGPLYFCSADTLGWQKTSATLELRAGRFLKWCPGGRGLLPTAQLAPSLPPRHSSFRLYLVSTHCIPGAGWGLCRCAQVALVLKDLAFQWRGA